VWGLIGNEAAVAALHQSLVQHRLAHALLLVGPAGVGKTTLAFALAQALNCLGPEPPCGDCRQCRRIAARLHPDVTVLRAETGKREIGIDPVRDLQGMLILKPFEGRQRVAIIPEAERLTQPAANALLKTLEEPPDQVTLVLTTADDGPLLPTIRSRCQRIELRPVDHATLAATLADRGAETETATFLARYARGRPGLALTALTDPDALDTLQEAFSHLRFVLSSAVPERLESLDALAAGQGAQREVTAAVLEAWVEWWRDLLFVQSGNAGGVVHPGELDAYHLAAGRSTRHQVRGAIGDLLEAARRLELNANPRLVLDVLALRLPSVPGLAPPTGQEIPASAPARAGGTPARTASGNAT